VGSWEDLHTKEMDTGQLEGLVRHARAKSEPAMIVGSVPVEVEPSAVRAKGSITIKREAIPMSDDTEQIQKSFTYPTAPGSSRPAMFAILIVAVAAGAIVAALLLR
jgi:hypothetical protein